MDSAAPISDNDSIEALVVAGSSGVKFHTGGQTDSQAATPLATESHLGTGFESGDRR